MTKLSPISVFALAFLCVALLCCSSTRIAPNVNGHTVPRIGSQRMTVQPASRQLIATCQSNEDCDDSQVCFTETCIPKFDLCKCDEPCSGMFDGFRCFQVTQDEETLYNTCLNLDDQAIDSIPASQSGFDVEPLVCDGAAGGNDTSESVCIDASMLTNFGSHELVFEKHVLAHVLCDMAGSCATKGHMVMYKDNAMMMRRYCEIVGCDEKMMMVNSPRYQRGLKVESKSKDMHFTAFAARYETRGEEMVLSVAARYGF